MIRHSLHNFCLILKKAIFKLVAIMIFCGGVSSAVSELCRRCLQTLRRTKLVIGIEGSVTGGEETEVLDR